MDAKSPYALTPTVDWYLGIYAPRTVPQSANDVLVKLDKKYEFRPDLLSYDNYGTSKYWWVFAVRNPNVVKDPIGDMVAGIQLYIPNADSINTFVG